MEKKLPQFGEICHFTIKLKGEDKPQEMLGYLTFRESEKEYCEDDEYFYDEGSVCYKRFLYIPEVDHAFDVGDIVYWRPLHSWNNNESTQPEEDGAYLVVLNDGRVTTLDYESWEGWSCYSDDEILYWMEFPEPPEEVKNEKRK